MRILQRHQEEERLEQMSQPVTIKREELISRLQHGSNGNNRETEKSENSHIFDIFYTSLPFNKKLSAKNTLLIDIATDKLYYLVGKKVGAFIQVKHWGEEEFAGEDIDRYKAIEIALKYIKDQFYKQGMEVNISFYSPDINIRQVVLPKLKSSELEKTLLYKNKSELPNFDEKAVWRYQVIENFVEKDVQKVRCLVTVVPGEVIETYMGLLKHAGLQADILIPRPFALQSAYQKMIENPQSDVIIDIGSDTTQICYIVDKKLRFVRNFALGANNLIKSIEAGSDNGNKNALSGKISLNQAAEDESPDNGKMNIRERLLKKVEKLKSNHNPLLQVLIGEILRSLEFFRGAKAENPINKIFLTGEGLKIESVYPLLKNNLHYSVYLLSPQFSAVKSGGGEYAAYTAGLGLGLLFDKKLNLIPSEFKTARLFKNLNLLFSVLFVMFLFVLGYYSWTIKKDIATKKESVKVTEAKYTLLTNIEKSYNNYVLQTENLLREKNTLLSPVKEVPQLLIILKFFSNEIPSKVRLTYLNFSQFEPNAKDTDSKNNQAATAGGGGYKYIVNVGAKIEGEYLLGDVVLIDFISHLNDLKYFREIKIKNKKKNLEDQYLEFELECYL